MISLENGELALCFGPSDAGVVLTDLRRGQQWRLEPSLAWWTCPEGKRTPLGAGIASRVSPQTVDVAYSAAGGLVLTRWQLCNDHVVVALTQAPDGVASVPLPGAFLPVQGGHEMLLPAYQGILCRPGQGPWEDSRGAGGHGAMSMAMAATLTSRAALLVTQETATDWVCVYGEDRKGLFFFFSEQRCPVEGWRPREVRLYPADPTVTAVCRRYRARVKERGEFVSWQEKMERRPAVADLFGALIAFTGYNRDEGLDYVANARRLASMGFDRVFYYPVRMCAYSMNFKMGGDDPVWLSDETLAELRRIPGARIAPWMWTVEALDGAEADVRAIACRDASGAMSATWQIDEQRWYLVCTPYEIAYARRRLESDMASMDWLHYDVGAMRLGKVCFSTDHGAHGNAPMGLAKAHPWSLKLLSPELNGNRVVSAEGFVDRFTVSYDVGSTKVIPAWGDARFVPVPMTMLVFHDSCIHDWWELDNYNEHSFQGRVGRFGYAGCGFARKKAAMDALYGLPPNVFPFGKQYVWVDLARRTTRSFRVTLDDTSVQLAISAALPVCRLHRRIGMMDLVAFEFLSDDLSVQRTTFADGTRVVANFSDGPRETDDGPLAPDSWRVLR